MEGDDEVNLLADVTLGLAASGASGMGGSGIGVIDPLLSGQLDAPW